MSSLVAWLYGALVCASLLSGCGASAPPPRLAPPGPPRDDGPLLGDTGCRPEEPDCNVCTPDVLGQLEALFDSQHADAQKHAWQATSHPYPPAHRTLHDATHRWWAVPRTHVQGFVHTGSEAFPYAISYSHREDGTLLLLSHGDDRQLRLSRIVSLGQKHPSGLAALGRHVLVASKDALHFFDLREGGSLKPRSIRVPRRDPKKEGMRGAGGGLAAARLDTGRTLVLAATPGGESPRPRTTRFYELEGALSNPRHARYLGEYVYENPPRWGERSFAFSENVSLITECGTGRLYAVYTTGDGRLGGEGYARVAAIEGGKGSPRMRQLAAYPVSQSSRRCHPRSAATLYVERQGGALRFLCHQRACRGWELELQFEIRAAP